MPKSSEILLRHLPAIYQEQPGLGALLQPFEAMLLGGAARDPENRPGLREKILSLADYLDPYHTDEEFLPWLGSWVALALREDLEQSRKRELIARATSLFAARGTRAGVEQLLNIVTGGTATITEPEIVNLRVGVDARVGITTRIGRELPFFFHVSLVVEESGKSETDKSQVELLARDTIDLGKPAHTFYQLAVRYSDETTKKSEPRPSARKEA